MATPRRSPALPLHRRCRARRRCRRRCSRPHATASCDTLSRATPFRGALRTSACLLFSGPPLPHHPAPPRPSGKRATFPLPPFDRPPFLFLTSLPPPLRLPSFKIIACAREDGLSAWRTSNWPGDPRERSIRARHQRRHRRRHQALQTALQAELSIVSAHFTLERRCHQALQTALRVDLLAMVAIVNTKRNKRIAYRVLDPELLCDIRAFDRTSRLRVHSPVRCGWGAWCWGGLDSAFGSCAFVDPLRVCFVDALWPRHGGPQCCHSTVAVA